jgi:ATP-binding cassette subfamily C (CFTR/MRP) protein 1
MCLVNYLPSADSVILMNSDGTIVQQGAYDELRLSENDVKILESKGKENDVSPSEGSDDKPEANRSKDKASAQSTSALELTRKTGDMSLYKFYFSSVGPTLVIGWMFLAGVYIFSTRIPRTCHHVYSLAVH